MAFQGWCKSCQSRKQHWNNRCDCNKNPWGKGDREGMWKPFTIPPFYTPDDVVFPHCQMSRSALFEPRCLFESLLLARAHLLTWGQEWTALWSLYSLRPHIRPGALPLNEATDLFTGTRRGLKTVHHSTNSQLLQLCFDISSFFNVLGTSKMGVVRL